MDYKPFVYRMLDDLFGSRFQELREAEIIKKTEKAYLIRYLNQTNWVPKQFVKIKKNKIKVEKWIINKEFA